MADVTVPLGGWGALAWGQAAWGEGSASLVGTGQVGSVTVAADANVDVSGLQATGSVGSVTVAASADVTVTGVTAKIGRAHV